MSTTAPTLESLQAELELYIGHLEAYQAESARLEAEWKRAEAAAHRARYKLGSLTSLIQMLNEQIQEIIQQTDLAPNQLPAPINQETSRVEHGIARLQHNGELGIKTRVVAPDVAVDSLRTRRSHRSVLRALQSIGRFAHRTEIAEQTGLDESQASSQLSYLYRTGQLARVMYNHNTAYVFYGLPEWIVDVNGELDFRSIEVIPTGPRIKRVRHATMVMEFNEGNYSSLHKTNTFTTRVKIAKFNDASGTTA